MEIGDAVRGAAAGMAAAAVQALVGKTEEKAFLPRDGDSDLAPRLVERLADFAGTSLSHETRWAAGTVVHFGYGAAWGIAYAALRERVPVHPLVGGALLGGVIYAITFPRWGGAVKTRVVPPPGAREDRMTVFAASVTSSFGLATALLYEAARPREDGPG